MVAMVAYAIQGCQELIQIAIYFILCERLLIPFHIEDAISGVGSNIEVGGPLCGQL